MFNVRGEKAGTKEERGGGRKGLKGDEVKRRKTKPLKKQVIKMRI